MNGFLNIGGDVVIEAQFDFAGSFSEGLAMVRCGDQWGFVDLMGGARYLSYACDVLGSMVSGFALVKVNGKYGFLNEALEMGIDPIHPYAEDFVEGLALVANGGMSKWGFLDTTGSIRVPVRFDLAHQYCNGFAAVLEYDQWFFIDENGDKRFGPFDHAQSFGPDVAIVRLGDRRYFIDAAGSLEDCPETVSDAQLGDNLFLGCEGGLFGIVDRSGAFVVPADYVSCRNLSENIVIVKHREKGNGYFSLEQNQELARWSQMEVSRFSEGRGSVSVGDGRRLFFDRCGAEVLRPNFKTSSEFHQGMLGFTWRIEV